MAGAGDGVQAQFVRFALGVFPFGNDADALAFDVLQPRVAAGQIGQMCRTRPIAPSLSKE